MPPKPENLDKILVGASLAWSINVMKNFFQNRPVTRINKKGTKIRVPNTQRVRPMYMTSKGDPRLYPSKDPESGARSLSEDLSDDAKRILKKKFDDAEKLKMELKKEGKSYSNKAVELKVSETLQTDIPFLESVRNVFTDIFLGFITPDKEPEPAQEEKRQLTEDEIEQDRLDYEAEQRLESKKRRLGFDTKQSTQPSRSQIQYDLPISTVAIPAAEPIDTKLYTGRDVNDFSDSSIVISGFNRLVEGTFAEEREKREKAEKEKAKKLKAVKQKKAQETTEDRQRLIRIESGLIALTDSEIKTAHKKIKDIIDPEDKNQDIKYPGIGIDKKTVDELIKTIPEGNRQTLGKAIRGLTGKDLKMNDFISGLVGVSVGLLTNPTAGIFTSGVIDRILNSYGVDINTLFTADEPIGAPSSSVSPTATININTNIQGESPSSSTDEQTEPENKGNNQQRAILRGYHNLVEMARASRISTSAGVGMLSAGAAGALTSGSGMTGYSSMVPGLLGGAVVGAFPDAGISVELTRALERTLARANIQIDENRRRQIRNIISTIPSAVIGAAIGYNPNNDQPLGAGVLSGAGVTESKLTVPQSVIDQTSAELNQKQSGNKIWQPKAISPSTDILNESRQERYADDLEFIAFNYIPPTSEGAQGTVDTNPLKYSQARESSLRYDEAGISIPYLVWNQIHDANDMTDKQITKLALGPVYLPDMIFMDQDNDTTFENVADYQYPNNEPMAIEFLSPYSDFSLVENYWMTNPKNMLFTVNP